MKNVIKSVIIFLVLGMGIVLFVLSHQIAGLRAFIVSSGSMEPTIRTGSLIVTKYIHPTNLKTNDIITFIEPTKDRQFITHRIVSISQSSQLAIIKTKGDHNNHADNWVLAGGGVVGKEIVAIPYLGYLFSFTQTKWGLLLCILLPSLYIVYSEIEYIYVHVLKRSSTWETAPVTGLVLLPVLLNLVALPKTYAILSDQASLTTNSFSIAVPLPPISPTPPGLNHGCTIQITRNASDSVNTVSCTNNSVTSSIQENSTAVTNTIIINSNTGGN